MARAARLSGQLDEEEEELMDLIDASKKGKQQVGGALALQRVRCS